MTASDQELTPLSDAELADLKSEHYPDTLDGTTLDGTTREPDRIKCHAASDDACAWSDGWPCRIARLIAMVERAAEQKA